MFGKDKIAQISQMIQKSTLKFLKDVSKNNDREWFAEHKDRYVTAKEHVADFGQAVFEELGKTDVLEKLKFYQIYRDVRFSKHKTPYKRHLGGHMVRATKFRRGGYYFHIEPGDTYITGAFWQPNKEDLLRVRQEIVANDMTFRQLITNKTFRKNFGELTGEQLKTSPKGFDKEHPAIDLLRYKQFVLKRKFSDEEVLATDFVANVVNTYEAMRPFLDYMSEILTTDENGEAV